MAGEIASAFVRIRPNMSGFQSDVESGVRGAFLGVGKIIGGALAATSAIDFGKSIVDAAAQHQAAFAVLDKAVQNAKASNDVYGQSLEKLLEREATLKGFSDEQLAQAFVRLVSVTHNSTKAFTDLQSAEDLSRARGIDLATAALAISKAEQGKATSLQRYGIILPKVTAAEDALTQQRQAALAAGAKFTAADNAIYDAALKAAKATDQQRADTEALTLIQQRFGGSAATFAKTASGEFQRLQQDFHQFEVAVGEAVLPGLTHAAEGLGKFTVALTQNKSFLNAERDTLHTVGSALETVKDVAQAIGPIFLEVAGAAGRVVSTIGAPPILAAVATYKSLSYAVGLATTATAFYQRVLAGTVPTAGAAAAANATLAASETAVAAAGEEAATGGLAAFAGGVADLGIGAAGGPIGLAVAGLAALAGGFVYLLTRATEAQQEMSRFARGLPTLGGAISAIPADKLAAQQARLNVEVANNALATTKAKPGSAQYKQLLLDQRQAILSLSQANQQLANDQNTVTSSTIKERDALEASIASMLKTDQFKVNRATGRPAQEHLAAQLEAKEVGTLVDNLDRQAAAEKAQSPLLAHNLQLIAEYAQSVKALPTKQTITFFLDNRNLKATLDQVEQAMRAAQGSIGKEGSAAGQTWASQYIAEVKQNLATGFAPTSSIWTGVIAGAKAVASAAATAVQVAPALQSEQSANQAINILNEQISTNEQHLAELKQQAELQAEQGAEAITTSINSAKQNFSSIGQTIAQDIQSTLAYPFQIAQQTLQLQGDRLNAEFDRQLLNLQTQAAKLQNAVSAIDVQQQARAARFAGRNALLTNQTNRLQLRQDQLNLQQLRREFILPGGRTLSTNNQAALRQLDELAAHARGSARLAIQQFAAQFQQAAIGVERDKITIATQVSPQTAQRQADLQLEQARVQLRTAIVSAHKASLQARIQIKQDIASIGLDLAAERGRIAAKAIADLTDAFNRAPSPAALKRVTRRIAQIMESDGVSFRTAGAVLGTAFEHGLQAQFAGLGLQGQALVGVPNQPGGGLIPQITHPLYTIQQQQQQAATVARDQRHTLITLQKEHIQVAKKVAAVLQSEKFIKSIERAPGNATKRGKALAGTTG